MKSIVYSNTENPPLAERVSPLSRGIKGDVLSCNNLYHFLQKSLIKMIRSFKKIQKSPYSQASFPLYKGGLNRCKNIIKAGIFKEHESCFISPFFKGGLRGIFSSKFPPSKGGFWLDFPPLMGCHLWRERHPQTTYKQLKLTYETFSLRGIFSSSFPLTKGGLRGIFVFSLLLFSLSLYSFAQESDDISTNPDNENYLISDVFKGVKILPYRVYLVRLNNGDILSGKVLEINRDKNKKLFIKLANILGNPIIYEDDIIEIYEEPSKNRHRHRHFIMPSAFEIGSNHFLANYMLGVFYAGVGISDFISITAGRTFIPTIESQYQGTIANVKLTIIDEEWDTMDGGLKVGIGGNLAFVNSANNLNHIYTNFTFYGEKTDITGLIFVKSGNEDIYDFRLNENVYNFIYEDGAFGLGLGITTKISSNHNLFFVGELWNTNITKKTNTALLGAIRLANTNFSADFGFVFMTVPFFIPVVNFAWTPF